MSLERRRATRARAPRLSLARSESKRNSPTRDGGARRIARAAVYARVSTTDQKTGLQSDEALRVIEARGWSLAATFEDVGISGTKDRRPGLDALLAAARKRKFDVLVVWRADRLFRSVHHMVATLHELAALGVDFVSCTESFDTSTPTGKLLFHICAAFAQFERDVIVERTVAGIAAARRRGRRLGRPRKRVDVAHALELMADRGSLRVVAKEMGVGYGTLRAALVSERKSSSPIVPDVA
jgi:DNA invertase Pin-like site-specific DNA recombinase